MSKKKEKKNKREWNCKENSLILIIKDDEMWRATTVYVTLHENLKSQYKKWRSSVESVTDEEKCKQKWNRYIRKREQVNLLHNGGGIPK